MRFILVLFVIAIAFLNHGLSNASRAHENKADEIIGVWLTEEKEAKIEIFRCADNYCGRIIWTIDPVYTQQEDSSRAGAPKTDDNNPDPALRTRPILGLQIISGLKYDEGHWVKGNIYDPESGRTYSCKALLISPDKLELRGYYIVPILGGKTIWTRVK